MVEASQKAEREQARQLEEASRRQQLEQEKMMEALEAARKRNEEMEMRLKEMEEKANEETKGDSEVEMQAKLIREQQERTQAAEQLL